MSSLKNPPSFSTILTRRAGLAALLASAVGLAALTMPAPAFAQDKTSIKVGIMSGEDEDVWRVAVKEAANDYTQPNEAPEHGERTSVKLVARASIAIMN